MNAQNAKDYLPLVQALAEGNAIEYQDDHRNWVDCRSEMAFDLAPSRYRIKPQAREWWLVAGVGNFLALDSIAKARQYTSDDAKIAHVKEVTT